MPHPVAGVLSARNLFLRRCALLVGRALRAHDGTMRGEVVSFLGTIYGVSDWVAARQVLETGGRIGPRRGARGIQEYVVSEE